WGGAFKILIATSSVATPSGKLTVVVVAVKSVPAWAVPSPVVSVTLAAPRVELDRAIVTLSVPAVASTDVVAALSEKLATGAVARLMILAVVFRFPIAAMRLPVVKLSEEIVVVDALGGKMLRLTDA